MKSGKMSLKQSYQRLMAESLLSIVFVVGITGYFIKRLKIKNQATLGQLELFSEKAKTRIYLN